MRSEFEQWFKTTKIYKDALNLELLLTYQSEESSDPLEKGISVRMDGNVEFYLWGEAESAWQAWQHRQTVVDELQYRINSALDEIKSALGCVESTETECVLRELEQALKGGEA